MTLDVVRPKGLSEQDIWDRRHFIGGSDANCIMNGAPEDVAELIAIKRGERPPKKLDDVLPVAMGTETEDLNRRWFTKKTGRPVTHAGERRVHFLYDWLAQTLDGMTTVGDGIEAIFEAKHTSERSTMDKLVERYYPQCQHAMVVSNVSWAVLSVFFGNSQWGCVEIEYDDAYVERLLEREKLFWACRLSGERWPDLPPPPRPDIAELLKVSKPLDMSANNQWCILAERWRRLKPITKELEQVTEDLTALVDRETKKTFGAGILATVAKNGSVTFKVDPTWSVANDDEISY
jgi:predicted phage-related endonuclease